MKASGGEGGEGISGKYSGVFFSSHAGVVGSFSLGLLSKGKFSPKSLSEPSPGGGCFSVGGGRGIVQSDSSISTTPEGPSGSSRMDCMSWACPTRYLAPIEKAQSEPSNNLSAVDAEPSVDMNSKTSTNDDSKPNKHRVFPDTWSYPEEIKGDLRETDLPPRFVDETLTTAWEYTRCIIPHFTNWARYLAYVRLIAISTVAEYNGALIDVAVQDPIILGYDINQLLDQLFGGTPVREEMAREFRANLLFTADKSCGRRNSDLFRRYVNALARGPKA